MYLLCVIYQNIFMGCSQMFVVGGIELSLAVVEEKEEL